MLTISNFNFAQRLEGETLYSPDGIFDNVFDKDGTIYKLSDITAGRNYVTKDGTSISNTLLCTSGIFELYFETGCGMENTAIAIHNQRRAILCQAFQDISDFINTPLKNSGNVNKVKIWIRSPTSLGLPANAGGAASAFYNIPLDGAISSMGAPISGIVDNEIWKTIHLGTNSYNNTVFPIINTQNNAGFYHGWACFNFAGTVNWNLDYNKYNSATGYVLNSSDFYTVIIHEITHALGFNSLISLNNDQGVSNLFLNSNFVAFGRYFSRYDKNLKTSSNTSLITNNPTTGGQMYDFNYTAPNSVLYPSCSLTPPVFNGNSGAFNCSTSLKYVGSTTVPIYNPPCFENGSSLSHFEDACYNGNTNDQYFMMSERASGLFAKRALTTEERQVLCDIGYSVKGTFGSTSNFTYKNYNVTACAGITVAGVNDGLTTMGTYAFQGNSGADITVSGILNNDYTGGLTSNLRFEFVQDLYDPNAIFSATTGSTSTSFTIKSFVPGLHLLRYVPFDNVTNQRGNITYIYVNVLSNCAMNTLCSLVKNGNFEEHNYAPNFNSQIYKACGWNNATYQTTCEYFNSDSTAPINPITGVNPYSVPTNIFGVQADKIAGNHAYAGMFVIPNRPPLLENVYSEPIRTELLNSLLPNTQYQLTFDVSMADNYLTNAIKFQAFITDTNLDLATGGIIPISNITPDKVFLTNSTFSGSTSANTWETVTFTFTTSSNANLKYLYIGGLNNVQFQGSTASYYYVDNVSLTRVVTPNFLDAVNDDFTGMTINTTTGGITTSVYSNDLYNGLPTSSANINDVTFALEEPISIIGATINNQGVVSIPAGTPIGTYTLNYSLSIIGDCTNSDIASITIKIVKGNITPTIVAGIRANDRVGLIGLQSSSKSIISGSFTQYNTISQNRIARLNTNLTLDNTFNASGPTPSNYAPESLSIQSDDKIIVVGSFTGFSGGSNGFGIARLNVNGSIDTSFNVGGSGISLVNYVAYTSAIQQDGKILVGGQFGSYNGVSCASLIRLNSNGSIDPTFSFPNYSYAWVNRVLIQPDGKILVEGLFGYAFTDPTNRHLIRLNSNGTLDTTFTSGYTGSTVPIPSTSYSNVITLQNMALQSDGKIIIVGAFTNYNGVSVNNIIRLLSNGQIDPTFNTSTGVERGINDLIIEPLSNKIIIGGEFTLFGTTAVKKLIRLNTNGTLDSTFSIGTGTTDSTTSPSCPYCSNYVKALKRQPDGKIIVGGKFTTFNGLSATNITRISGSAGVQARSSVIEFQSEPEIDTNPDYNGITIYPNPSKGIYTIDFTQEKENSQLIIVNILGEVVFTTILSAEQQNQIDITHLASGYYIARISNSTTTSQHKLIKN